MKKLFMMLSAVLVLASCSKDIDSGVQMADSEGAMRLGVAMPADFDAEDGVVIKIYKQEQGEQKLVRRYDAVADVPEYLALIEGDYVAKVQVGEKNAVSFDTKYYLGEREFAVEPGVVTPVTVDCKLQSTIVVVNYDATVAEKLTEGYFTNVSIAESYDDSAIATGDILSLEYTETKGGYFIMPEGKTSLYWHFEGTHPVEGEIVKEGLIKNVKPSAKYTITLKYSKDAPGNLVFEATVDKTLEEYDDTMIFSPDPTILGDGFDATEMQLSTTESRRYNIASLAAINLMTMTIDGVEYNLLESAPEAVILDKIDDMTYTLDINKAFFNTVTGGEQTIAFHIEDIDGGKLQKDIVYMVQGVLPLTSADYDLWFERATFKAVTIGNPSSVKIAYSANGGEWQELEASQGADGNYVAQLDTFNAATTYSYKLVVDSADAGKNLSIATPSGAQLPNGDMERWSKPTWYLPYGEGDAAFWLTGNEGGNMAGATLTQPSDDVRPGSTGSQSAYLKSQKASVMGIGKFAAGNLFTGTFAMNGLDGIVTFGRDFTFTAKPKSLSFWMKNNEGTINEGSHASGSDIYTIMVIITDGTTYAVNTKDESSFLKVDQLANTPGVIGYGYISGSDSRAEWTEETINITYVEGMKNTKPKKIVVSFTPSGYGDYFCGSTSSWMYIDDIVLNY
ncbi:MAG: DUF4493 domain-containing protein [Alistipes sp.]|nr:DUF4493 domain-containing protein [Alistipes sp.]